MISAQSGNITRVTEASILVAGTPSAPAFNPPAGTYSIPQSVTLSSTTPGAVFRYTTDGTTPSSTNGTLYSGPIALSVSATVKALAFGTGPTPSGVVSAAYVIGNSSAAAAPTFSPAPGVYSSAQSVAISTTTAGAVIHYTTDGTTPSGTSGTLYTGPLTVSVTMTINAVASASGMADSPVTLATYTIDPPAATPTFSPAGGVFMTAQTVTISSATSGATIRYTTDGTTPTPLTGTVYAGPITISASTNLQAVAYETHFTTSGIGSAVFTIEAYRQTVTISHSMVSGSSALTNFPLLFSMTDPSLRTVANGGGVGKIDGTDIVFMASDGVTKLDHELEFYAPTTGQVIAWIRIPTLSASVDTVIYVEYGSASAIDQQNKNGAWNANYKGVWHLASGSTLSTYDSTINGLFGTNNNVTSTSGQIDGAGEFSSAYLSTHDTGFPSGTTARTIEAWVNAADFSAVRGVWDFGTTGTTGEKQALRFTAANTLQWVGSNADINVSYSFSTGTWYHLACVFDGSNAQVYVNGVGQGLVAEPLWNTVLTGTFLIGEDSLGPDPFVGAIDEVRASNVALSSSWIATEFANQSAPATFVSLNSTVASPTFSPTAGTYTSTQSVTISTSTSGASIRYTTDGSTPNETAGTLYSSPVSVSANTTIKAIAYKSGMTDSSVSSATYTISGGGSGWYSTGGTWTNRKPLTINHSQVSGSSNLTNFPMLFSVTDVDLKTVTNGGSVGKSDGTDILFTASDGVTKLNHELESYNGTTGAIIAWVQIPTLSPTTDTVIYAYYGNASATNQQNVAGTWDSNYQGVWHLPNGSTLSVNDSTSNATNGTDHGATATTGKIDGGATTVSASTQYIDFGTIPSLSGASQAVMQVWFKRLALSDIAAFGTSDADSNRRFLVEVYSDGNVYITATQTDGSAYGYFASNDASWHKLDVAFDGTQGTNATRLTVYLDGVQQTLTFAGTIPSSLGTEDSWLLGYDDGSLYSDASFDEYRLTTGAVRSSGWIVTEFNNQSAPSTFVTEGAQQ